MPFDRETPDEIIPGDASTLAEAVRALAGHAHRVLTGSPASSDLRDILWQIRLLQRQLRHRRLGDLHRWLDNLHRRIETRWRLNVPPVEEESPRSPTAA